MLGLGHTARKHVLRHARNIVSAIFRFMFDISRLDVQTPKHVWRRCYVDVSWPGTSVWTTTRVNIPHESGRTVYCVTMLWPRDLVFWLIDVYRANPILWNPTNPNYKDRNKKCDTWKAIGAELNVEVMKKIRTKRTILTESKENEA